MADFYGEAGKNPFALSGVGGVLSTVTNASNGVAEIYRQGALGRPNSLGTFNPSSGKFTPREGSGLTNAEIKALSSENNLKNIKNKSKEVVKKGLVAEGSDPETAEIKSNQIVSPNSLTTFPTEESVQTALSNLNVSEKSGTRTEKDSIPNLRYPANLKTSSQDVIKFTMLRYKPKSYTTSPGSVPTFSERSTEDRVNMGTVALPIPGGISDTNSVSWGEDRMTAAQIALANIALTGITEGVMKGVEQAGEILTNAVKSKDLKAAIAAGFAEQASGVTNILGRQGTVINPNMELLFQGPSLRPFNFTFKLSARGKDDREQIRKIIRFFKQGMAVKKSESNLFLKAPNTFKIQYLHRDRDHQYLNRIKECALQSFTVNYTPEGNYMSFPDGLMTSYEISMQFTELEPIFNDDYSKLDGNRDDTIGY